MLLVPPPLHLRPRHLGGRLGSRGDVAARQEQRRPSRRAGGDYPVLASQGQVSQKSGQITYFKFEFLPKG